MGGMNLHQQTIQFFYQGELLSEETCVGNNFATTCPMNKSLFVSPRPTFKKLKDFRDSQKVRSFSVELERARASNSVV